MIFREECQERSSLELHLKANLGAEVLEQGVRLPIGAAGELNLLHHLVGAVVNLLFGGDDAEQVDDEGQQQDGDEDEYHRAEVVGFAAFVL